MLLAAALLVVAVVAAHSWLGERYILRRLFRQTLPALFGDDRFTKQTLRFAWHVTSVLGLGLAALLVLVDAGAATADRVLYVVGATFLLSGLFPLLATRGKHLSWLAFFAVAALCFGYALGT